MENIYIKDGEEFIKLGQLLKKAGAAESGAFAKEVIVSGDVKVNGETELRRGRKLYEGDVVSFDGIDYKVLKI